MPFFLYMSFIAPHPPLTPPALYLDLYKDMDIPEPVIGNWAEKEDLKRNGLNPQTGKGIVNPKMLKHALAGYYALITQIDHQIGRFLTALKEFGVLENTIVVFTSDHGDMMGDHNLYRKRLPYEGSAHVPLILHDLSGKLKIKQGYDVDQPVELMDIMPTLLEAAGIPIPDSVEGSSMLSLARGETSHWREYIHGETEGPSAHHFLTDGVEKYIWFAENGREQLFHLREDPQEMIDRALDTNYSDQLEFWRQRLVKELTGRTEGFTDGEKLIPVKQ